MRTLADAFLDKAEQEIDPAFLAAIRDWKRSSCLHPDRYPSAAIAPHWPGPGSRCGACGTCRPEQRYPTGDFDVWLYLGGRGTGKTRSAAEVAAEHGALNRKWRIGILAPTYADARDTCVEGESGLIAVFERFGWEDGRDFTWNRSLGELIVHTTGTRYKLYSAEKPARLRGPQHHFMWVDELAQVVRDAVDAWDMMKFGLRLGQHPRTVATTTPLPVNLIKELLVDERCVVTRGTTDDNRANLPASVLRDLHKKYDGTRLGRQELKGELLDDIPGALWLRFWLDRDRIDVYPELPSTSELAGALFEEADQPKVRALLADRAAAVAATLAALGITLVRVVVGVDPAVTSGDKADETGIIVAGKAADGHIYILDDCTLRATPDLVQARIIDAYDAYEANAVIVEVNNGGEYITSALRNALALRGRNPSSVPVEAIRAKKGKRVRAEPAAALYGQKNVHHIGTLVHLEDQVCVWEPAKVESPDRMDALVYAILFLADITTGSTLVRPPGTVQRHNQQRAQMSTTSVGSRRTA